jgi:hypothetical protein
MNRLVAAHRTKTTVQVTEQDQMLLERVYEQGEQEEEKAYL